MFGIYTMAVVTLIASAVTWGGMVYLLSGRLKCYLWLLLPGVPFSLVVNAGIKTSLAILVGQIANILPHQGLRTPGWFVLFLFMLSPVLEEGMKVVPLLLPRAWRLLIKPAAALWVGIMLGVGFGLGEAAYIAYSVAQLPEYSRLPWYAFTGYAGERWITFFMHGVMTAVFVIGLQRTKLAALAGYFGATGLHALVNAGPMLARVGIIPTWATSVCVVGAFTLTAYIFERLRHQAARGAGISEAAGEILYFERRTK